MTAAFEGCRTARRGDLPRLKQIWRECFGDTDEYIDCFFDDLFKEENMVVLEEDGAPVSMAALLPCTLVLGSETYPISYLYAMSTLPEYQGRGLGGRLLRFAAEYCRGRGDAGIALQPADKGLVSFYARFGYVPAFTPVQSDVNYILYDDAYISHVVNLNRLETEEPEGCTGIPPELLKKTVPGVFLSLSGPSGFTAYMAYPMD